MDSIATGNNEFNFVKHVKLVGGMSVQWTGLSPVILG